MQNVMDHTGKAAVFIRGFMTKFNSLTDEGKQVALRVCQNAGLDAVNELGENISVPYISKLARELSDEGVIGKKKQGRKYFLKPTDKTDAFLDWMNEHSDWGADMQVEDTTGIEDKMEIVKILKKHKGLVIYASDPLPKVQYGFLMKKFNEGKLDMAFVMADQNVIVTSAENSIRSDLLMDSLADEYHELTDVPTAVGLLDD